MANRKWNQNDIPDLTGKVVIVTGANSGLGLESTRALAAKGATVVMACRSLRKAEAARQDVLAGRPAARLDILPLDNADLASVRAFAATFRERYDRLDILLNNAGIMAVPYAETADGFESQFGVNHLAHFALTGLLLDVLTATPGARVHNVSSSANYYGTSNFDDVLSEQAYGRWTAYYQSKLANVLFAYELNARLAAAGHDTISNSSHPGLVIGQLQQNSAEQSESRLEQLLYPIVGVVLGQDVSMGVLPQLYASTAPAARGGAFYGPGFLNLRGYPKEQSPNKLANDRAVRARLWDLSAEWTGVDYLTAKAGVKRPAAV